MAQDAKEIVVYNAQHERLGEAWAAAFTAETGIKVTLRNVGGMEFAMFLVAGFMAARMVRQPIKEVTA